MSDPFDLSGEARILKSGIRKVLTPHQPIDSIEFFFGRSKEVKKVVETLNTPGLHFLLYGERGVGKSSLGNITVSLLIEQLYKDCTYVERCDKQTTIEDIFEKPLRSLGLNVYEVSSVSKEASGLTGGLDLKIVKLSGSDGQEKQITYMANAISPSYISEKLAQKKGVLIIDEFDAIKSDVKEKIGELIKLLSDSKSPFKLLIIGVGNNIRDLLAGNPSNNRHVKQIKLARMSEDEIRAIIITGSKKVKIRYHEDVVNRITDIAAGYPHFAHLLALKSGEIAIRRRQKDVSVDILIESINDALQDTEKLLQQAWTSTMGTLQSELYLQILIICASITRNEIKAVELRRGLKSNFGIDYDQNVLNQYLTRLVADDESRLLHRISKGIYRFSESKMSSFVKIKAIEYKPR